MAVLTSVIILGISGNTLGTKVQYTSISTSPERKPSSMLKLDDLAGQPAGAHNPIHAFRTITSRKEIDRACNVSRSFNMLENALFSNF